MQYIKQRLIKKIILFKYTNVPQFKLCVMTTHAFLMRTRPTSHVLLFLGQITKVTQYLVQQVDGDRLKRKQKPTVSFTIDPDTLVLSFYIKLHLIIPRVWCRRRCVNVSFLSFRNITSMIRLQKYILFQSIRLNRPLLYGFFEFCFLKKKKFLYDHFIIHFLVYLYICPPVTVFN